ncbi:Cysteinyl-tRNA synthetase [Aphelenchoides bicaudatus]|nr:Cysteinyl-tRNA synthetase [Aphelenchoides bicaudatus]
MAATSPQLRIYNSLTRTKDVFRPLNGNQVKLYICGPTVYDSAHMGHARAYLSFDILRRVLSSYFNYDVLYAMNITNVDDKIIKRARQSHLYESYLEENKANLSKVLQDIEKSIQFFKNKFQEEADPDKRKMMSDTLTKVNTTVRHVEEALTKSNSKGIEQKSGELLQVAKDVLCEWLDHEKGSSITEMSVFSKLADRFEADFFEDMKRLNVKTPDVLTRVSEYMPEILDFVQGIINKGYGYKTSDGSVYFDTEAFANSPNHRYAKLLPEAFGDKENAQKHLQESEGVLSMNQMGKKSSADFALWKASKAGEPSWKSQFGDGRPGWHIECSAMSTAIFGPTLDIHAGGSDLKFPHHDNEIAQCEAHYDKDQWVNYFLHCGTLRIEGLKMSKSLKNFITIKKALDTYTARQILSQMNQLNSSASTLSPDLALLGVFSNKKAEIHEALCDSIDTRLVIEKMREVINASNIYMKENTSATLTPNAQLLKQIAEYLTSLLKMFGAISEQEQLGYPAEDSPECALDREAILMPHLEALANFRSSVRDMARGHKNINILKECDRLRDEVLPKLGVRFEDGATHTIVKLVS